MFEKQQNRPTQKEEEEETEEDFTEKFLRYAQKLSERQDLGEEVIAEAVHIMEEMKRVVQQHYQPKHMAAGSLVIASRIHDDPRTINQMAQSLEDMNGYMESKEHVKEVRRAMKKIRDENNFELDPVLADDFLDVVLDQVRAEDELKNRCKEVMDTIKDSHKFYGRSQIGVAASVVYLSSRSEDRVKEIGASKLSNIVARNKKTIQDTARIIRRELGEGVES